MLRFSPCLSDFCIFPAALRGAFRFTGEQIFIDCPLCSRPSDTAVNKTENPHPCGADFLVLSENKDDKISKNVS